MVSHHEKPRSLRFEHFAFCNEIRFGKQTSREDSLGLSSFFFTAEFSFVKQAFNPDCLAGRIWVKGKCYRSLKSPGLHDGVIVQSSCCLIVEVFVVRDAFCPLVEKSWVQDDVGHQLNHFLFLQLRCNCGTAINFH